MAIVGELAPFTIPVLQVLRHQMLQSESGRELLLRRPLITSESLSRPTGSSSKSDLPATDAFPEGSLGQAYLDFMLSNGISADSRSPTLAPVSQSLSFSSISDPREADELAYLLIRYRQIHDFIHVLLGAGIDLRQEIALKWFEMASSYIHTLWK